MQPSAGQIDPAVLGKMGQAPGLFAALSASERQIAASYFTLSQVPAASELWTVGTPGDALACILAGGIELKVDTEFPGKQIVVGVFTAGAVIGASCVLDDLPHATTAKALEPTTLLLLSRERFGALAEEHPQLGVKLLKGVLLSETNRLRKAYARLASIF
jgi:CRP-like cAMP-binding protein